MTKLPSCVHFANLVVYTIADTMHYIATAWNSDYCTGQWVNHYTYSDVLCARWLVAYPFAGANPRYGGLIR